MKRREYLTALIWRDPLTQEFLKRPHPDRFDQLSPEAQIAWKQYRQQQDRLSTKWGAKVRPLPPGPEAPEAQRYFALGTAHANEYLRDLALLSHGREAEHGSGRHLTPRVVEWTYMKEVWGTSGPARTP